MLPYYDKDGITIYKGDCVSVMEQFSDSQFDLVLTDPPLMVLILLTIPIKIPKTVGLI